jgi:hypothetical protein
VLRGAKIVFCDSHKNCPGMDENSIEVLITTKTKVIIWNSSMLSRLRDTCRVSDETIFLTWFPWEGFDDQQTEWLDSWIGASLVSAALIQP